MKLKITVFILILSVCPLFSNENAFMMRQKGLISFSPVFQYWNLKNNRTLYQQSSRASIYWPMGMHTGLTVTGSQAAASGKQVTALAGLGDTQVQLFHYMENLNSIFSLNLNLPTGKNKLTAKEFDTIYELGYQMYQFKLPALGQGFCIAPGLSYARTIRENFVLGLGLSFSYKAAYSPFSETGTQYNPGEETIISSGFDYKINERWTVSTDLTYSIYTKDKRDKETVLKAGNRISLSTHFRYRSQDATLNLYCQYRTKAKNEYQLAGGWITESKPTVPDLFLIRAIHRKKQFKKVLMDLHLEYHHISQSLIENTADVFVFGLTGTWLINTKYALPITVKLYNGDVENAGSVYSGYEVGAGLLIQL